MSEDIKLLCVLLVSQIYADIRNIVREELERVGLKEVKK
jgi:hypothetical protein